MVKVFDSNDLPGLFSGFPVDDDDDDDTTVKKFPKNVKKFGPDFISPEKKISAAWQRTSKKKVKYFFQFHF